MVQTAAGASVAFTPESGGGKDWDTTWKTYLEKPLMASVKDRVNAAWDAFQGLGIKVSTDAWQQWGIEAAEDAEVTILEKVQEDLRRLAESPKITTGQLPIWGGALVRKYGSEYESQILDKAIRWWNQKTGQNVVAPTTPIESHKVGGGMMTLEQRLSETERIAQSLNQRVAQADTDQMIDQKLQASKLPESVRGAVRAQLIGKQVSQAETEQFIGLQQRICAGLETGLAAKAGVTLEGGMLPGNDDDTIDGALNNLFESQMR